MVKMIRKDLNDLKTVANGEARSTDRTRAIQASLLKGEVPPIWLKYPIPEITVNAWVRTQPRHPNPTHLCMRAVARASPMTRLVTWALLLHQVTDFVARSNQLVEVAAAVVAACKDGIAGMSSPVWMGGFFMPGAFLTVRPAKTPSVHCRASSARTHAPTTEHCRSSSAEHTRVGGCTLCLLLLLSLSLTLSCSLAGKPCRQRNRLQQKS